MSNVILNATVLALLLGEASGATSSWSHLMLNAIIITLLLQGFLFPLLVLIFPYSLWHISKGKSKSREQKQSDAAEEESAGLPPLQPLKCTNCGTGVPLQEEEITCLSCGASVAAPEYYATIGRLRSEALSRLRRAEKYLKRAQRFSSNYLRWMLYLIALWLFVSPFLLGILADDFKPEISIDLLIKYFPYFFITLVLWILILCLTAGGISKVHQVLPGIEGSRRIGEAEVAQCTMCGGSLAFEEGSMATICGYCGVETYRVKVAWQMRRSAGESRQAATTTLVEAMRVTEEKMDDLISTPAILIFIFVVCPILLFLLFFIPYVAYIYISKNLLISIIVIACLVASGYLLRRFYQRKA